MKLSVVQESNARRSPYPGKGLNGKEIAGEGNRDGAGLRDGRLHDRHWHHVSPTCSQLLAQASQISAQTPQTWWWKVEPLNKKSADV